MDFPHSTGNRHRHPHTVHQDLAQHRSLGQRTADRVASAMGSWPFLIAQSALLACWMAANLLAWRLHWVPYPFILLNLCLSTQAAYAAPLILISQNRQAQLDRAHAENAYHQTAEILAIQLLQMEILHELHQLGPTLPPPPCRGTPRGCPPSCRGTPGGCPHAPGESG